MYGFTLLALAASALAQGVTQSIAPTASAPAGCQTNYPSTFQIQTFNASANAQKVKRQSDMGQLTITLKNGVLTSNRGATGYIAANYQFQFDSPPQTGAIYTAGFSVCGNGSLALGGSAIFYSCNSGNFNNLYDRNWAPQCSPVYINALPVGSASGSASAAPSSAASSATQRTDGQPNAATSAARPASSAASQISDNQPQAATSAPRAMSSSAAVTQIGDNQPQAATSVAAPRTTGVVSQIGDNQPQAATSARNATYSPVAYTGGAALPTGMANLALAGAGVLAAAML